MDLAQQLMLEQYQKDEAAKEQARQLREQLLKAEVENMSPLASVQVAPLAGAIDSAFGTRVAPGIQAAEAKREPMRKRADDLLDGLMEGSKSASLSPLLKQADSAGRQSAIDERAGATRVDKWFDRIGSNFDKERKALDEVNDQFLGIENAIASGEYERIKGQLSNYARAVNKEKGVLTDPDIDRTYIDTLDTIYNKFYARFDKTGKLNPGDLRNLASAIVEARAALQASAAKRLQQKRNSYEGNPDARAALRQHESVGEGGYVTGTLRRAQTINESPLIEWQKNNGLAPVKKPAAGPPGADDEINKMVEALAKGGGKK